MPPSPRTKTLSYLIPYQEDERLASIEEGGKERGRRSDDVSMTETIHWNTREERRGSVPDAFRGALLQRINM